MDTLTDPTTWRFPSAETIVLDNGLLLQLVDMPGKFVATVAVSVAIPSDVETPDTEGVVAAWTTMMLLDAPFASADGVGTVARIGAGVTSGCDHRGPKVIADCPRNCSADCRAAVELEHQIGANRNGFGDIEHRT